MSTTKELVAMARDRDPLTRSVAARNTDTPKEWLDALAKDPQSELVQMCAKETLRLIAKAEATQ